MNLAISDFLFFIFNVSTEYLLPIIVVNLVFLIMVRTLLNLLNAFVLTSRKAAGFLAIIPSRSVTGMASTITFSARFP